MTAITEVTETFVPIFVAMSPLTILPIFLNMTEHLDSQEARSLARGATMTAFCIAVSIVLIGQSIFRLLGITIDDLRVAGGIILLIIAIYDLIFTREQRKTNELTSESGVVPLGTPLIVGPASMTTCIVAADQHGHVLTLLALSINLGLIALLLHFSQTLKKYIRPAISRAFGKVMSLFLAAIAVAMLRAGVTAFIAPQ